MLVGSILCLLSGACQPLASEVVMMNIPQGNETVTSVAGIGLVVRLSFHCAGKMAKQTLVFESPKELSLKDNMIVIKDRDTEEMTLRSLEDIRLIMIDNHSVRISHTV